MLLKTSEDETIHRVAAGAIANLAMNGKNVGPQFNFFFSQILQYWLIKSTL